MAENSANAVKVLRWLRPLAFPFDATQPRAAVVELKHVNVQDKLTPVRAFKVSEGEDFDEVALGNLVSEIEGAVQDDVDGLGGTQKYVLVATDAPDKKQVGRLPFRASAPMDDGDGEVGSEPATAKGNQAAMMRHVDNAHRMAVGSAATTIQSLERQNRKKDEVIDNLVARALSTITLAEQLLSQRHERDMEAEAARAAQRRKDKFMNTAANLLGPIAKKLTGVVAPGGDDMPFNQQELKTFFEGVTEEEFAAFKASLSPERFFQMLSLMQSFKPESFTEGPPRGDDEPDGAGPNGAGH